jgi:hypothetical protein
MSDERDVDRLTPEEIEALRRVKHEQDDKANEAFKHLRPKETAANDTTRMSNTDNEPDSSKEPRSRLPPANPEPAAEDAFLRSLREEDEDLIRELEEGNRRSAKSWPQPNPDHSDPTDPDGLKPMIEALERLNAKKRRPSPE